MQIWQSEEVTTPDDSKTYKGISHHQEQTAEAFQKLGKGLEFWLTTINLMLTDEARQALTDNTAFTTALEALQQAKAEDFTDKAAINVLYKQAEEAVAFADKTLKPAKDKTFTKDEIRTLLKRISNERDDLAFVLDRVGYFAEQLHWLDSHFPDGVYRDVEGLCKLASQAEIAEQQYSLNPGRYVGVALEDDGMTAEEFRMYMQTQVETLANLHTEADQLQQQLTADLKLLFLDVNVEEEV